jgi:fucose permease
MLAGLGSGLVDAGWNAWIGAMPNSSGIMGSLHSFYGIGAALAPVAAAAIIAKEGCQWYDFYYLMALAALMELCTSTAAFWSATGQKYRTGLQRNNKPDLNTIRGESEDFPLEVERRSPLVQALGNSSTWLISLFIFLYAGIEIGLADWILTFLVDVRKESTFAGSMVTFGYWGGLTLGRVVIGFLIPLFKTDKGVVTTCLAMTILMHLIFSLKADLVTSAAALPLLGFFLGPLFPEAVIMQTKLVPKSLHIAAIGFSCALGSAGGCVLPFFIGALANSRGIWILQPFVLVALLFCLALWLAVPDRPVDEDENQDTLQG